MIHQRPCGAGTVAVTTAICLVPLLTLAAIVLDGGVLLDDRRQAQTAADAAALAAATDLFTHYATNDGTDPNGSANQSALTTAKADGYSNDGSTNKVTVNIPPKSGAFTGKAGYVEVIIAYNQTRYFSNVVGSGTIQAGARAVARGLYTPSSPGILVLDPTDNNTLDVTASGGVTVTNHGSITDDSKSANGGLTITNTGNVTADTVNLSDGTYNHSNSGNIIANTINYNQAATPDPLASMPEPSQPSAPSLSGPAAAAYSTNNGINYSGSTTLDLYPGYYPGLNLSSTGGVVLHDNLDGSPGIYYIGSHGLSATNAGGISGSNVMIYSAGTGNISLTGSGNMTLSPPTTGTYQGITLFQERSSNKQISITAQGNMSLTGTFYAAAAKVAITGQGNFSNPIGSQWIAYQLAVTGSGSFTVNYSGNGAPVRDIKLVE